MLQAINDRAKGVIGWIVIALISVPFALWGIQEYVGGGQESFAAKVNDVEISVREFDQAVSRQRQRLSEMFGGQLPEGAAFDKQIKQQVLDQLITRQILEQMALDSGFRVSDKMLSEKIQSMEVFQQDGKFEGKTYKALLGSQGMSVTGFEHLMRRDLLVQQVQDGLVGSVIVGKNALEQLGRLQEQTRDVSYLLYKHNSYLSDITLTDTELQQYFDENQSRYMHPEQVRISYVELKSADLKVDVPVDEESLRRQYDEYVASLADQEQRKAKHILIQLDEAADTATQQAKKALAESVLKKLDAGESFEDLAKSVSEDPGSSTQGGDLGWVSKGMMVPAFEEALYQLQTGEISELVKTGFGFHIIKLEEVKGATPESFEKKKSELVAELRQNEIDNQFYERSELMATTAYENDNSLQPVADTLGLEVKQSTLFTRTSGLGVAKEKKIRDVAFQASVIKEGRNSDVIELEKNHIIVLRVDEHVPSKPKTLEEVRPQLEASLKLDNARLKAKEASLQTLADLQQGKSLVDLTQRYTEMNALGSIKRDFKDAHPQIVKTAFQMPKPEGQAAYETVELADAVAVIILAKVANAKDAGTAESLKAIEQQIESSIANQELTAVIEYLKSQSDITIANDLL